MANINQIRKSLDLYFNTYESYPIAGSDIELGTNNYDVLCSGAADGGFKSDISDCGANAVFYIDRVPKAFGVDADCSSGTDAFMYTSDGSDYSLKFCLGRKISNIGPGDCTASSESITCNL